MSDLSLRRTEKTTETDLRIGDPPKLGEIVEAHGMVQGMKEFDQEFQQWTQNLRKAIEERMESI